MQSNVIFSENNLIILSAHARTTPESVRRTLARADLGLLVERDKELNSRNPGQASRRTKNALSVSTRLSRCPALQFLVRLAERGPTFLCTIYSANKCTVFYPIQWFNIALFSVPQAPLNGHCYFLRADRCARSEYGRGHT